jgi:hypothetical protein
MSRRATELALTASLLMGASAHAQKNLTLQTVLDRLHVYLADYAERLPATIATEQYAQQCGGGFGALPEKVALISEFGIMRLGIPGGWIGLRDVLSVNGRPVPDRQQRLQDLFKNPSSQGIQQARRIAQQNARFNVGRLQRTINDPAVVLEVLDGRNAARIRFTKTGETSLSGVGVWTVKFDERRRPTIIQTPGWRDQPTRGIAWIDPLTGRLVRVEIMIDSESDHIGNIEKLGFTATINVTFKDEPRLRFWVPSSMVERYRLHDLSSCSGEATYTDYRTFGVETKIISCETCNVAQP